MKLIVGLGNPGKQYEDTFHNAGFQVIDEVVRLLKKHERCHSMGEKKHALYGGEDFWYTSSRGTRERIFLQKPLTYMNDSGKAVGGYLQKHRGISNLSQDLWVIHDDGDILLGRIRVDVGKRAAGHRGVVSITSTLGTKDFVRFRVGIRREDDTRRTETFVLKKPLAADRTLWKETITRCAHGVIDAFENGITHAQMSLHADNNNEKRFTRSDAVQGASEERSKAYSSSTVSSTRAGNEEMRRPRKS